jgi:hypothetical protein
VLARDPRVFGIWPRFAVAVRLAAGRHRIVARIGAPDTSIRVLDLRGAPVDASSSSDPAAPYAMTAPKPLPDPNALAPFLADVGVREDPVWPRAAAGYAVDTADPILRFVAADLAHVDGQDDLASVLFEPLVKDASNATALALATQAAFVDGDPVFAPNDARDLALDLRRRATDKDAGLWFPRLWLLLDAAEKGGAKDQLAQLAELAASFPDVPAVGKALAQLYARLGYKPEHQRTILSLAQRFPDDTEILRALLSVQDDAGRHAEADKTVERITRLEPSSTIEVERALLRADFATAAAVVEREAKSASDENRAALARRVNDLLLRAGKRSETLALVERELAESGAAAGLRVADARLAAGDHAALRRALADAILTGAETAELRDAIEVVDGITELESFRLDPMATIRAYEASGAAKAGMEKGKGSAGTAARVLDYAAMSVHKDGSARMLEHEILHMQSREAITEHAEQRLPRGKLLRIRTIKPDGRTFEPEVVAGKPTVTMPHLELGDYIETETLYDMPSEGRGGRSFVGPRWFFREEKVDYHQSEFVVISPKDRPLVVEVTGAVPQPSVVEQGEIVVRRWRVDKNPALPQEPFAARIEEFLPSVRVGWGVTQAETLRRLSEAVTNVTPADPRLVRVAKTIATAGAPEAEQARQLAKVPLEERARRVYRWVLDNVEPGREADPRRTVLGKTGNRVEAFVYLARLAGVEVRHALVQDRLAPPPVGPISEAELFSQLALVMKTTRGETWTVVGDKYAPFGYLPSSLRGQPAVVLEPDLPRTKTNRGGTLDGVAHEGEVKLAGDGSARIALEQRYEGRLAIELRTAIQSLPEDRLKDVVEAKLLAQAIPGGRLSSLDIQGLVDLDGPLVLKMAVEASTFARRQGNDLVLSPPMQVSLAGVASLDKRETPLIVAREGAIRVAVRLRITLPDGAKVASVPAPAKGDNDGRSFAVNDRLERGVLLLDRVLDVPSGRVQPADYPAFVAFARAVDEALQPEFVIHLR